MGREDYGEGVYGVRGYWEVVVMSRRAGVSAFRCLGCLGECSELLGRVMWPVVCFGWFLSAFENHTLPKKVETVGEKCGWQKGSVEQK